MGAPAVGVEPILPKDFDRIGAFLHRHMNARVPAAAWRGVLQPPWAATAPNHGFKLVSGDEVVGAYVAVYSTRSAGDRELAVCNLAAFCVLPEHRLHSLRLVRAVLAQKGYVFTDLSPSGNVPSMNDRLGFQRLDTATRLVVNRPALASRSHRITASPSALADVLRGDDAAIYRDHRGAPAARHLLAQRDDQYAYLIYRRDRRKRLPLFASPLYVGGSAEVLEAAWAAVSAHLLRRGLVATLAERRILGFLPTGPGRHLSQPRPKMFKARDVASADIDYLYSELTLLQW